MDKTNTYSTRQRNVPLKRILIKSEMAELPDDLIQDESITLNVTSNQLNELQTVFNDPGNFYYIVDHFGNLMMKINTNVEPKNIKKIYQNYLNRIKVLNLKINMWQFSLNL